MKWKRAGVAAALALTVAACGTSRDDRVSGGAAAGAATGAGIGALGGPVGALAGAGIGGAAGAVTGATTSPEDVNLGRPPWSNPEVRTPAGSGGSRTARAPSRSGGSADANVREMQQALARSGHNPGAADGLMGPQTADALRSYQRANGLPETGRFDTRTRQALNAGGPATAGTRSGADGTATGTGTTGATPMTGGGTRTTPANTGMGTGTMGTGTMGTGTGGMGTSSGTGTMGTGTGTGTGGSMGTGSGATGAPTR
jgi:hypothetical protein